MMKETTGRKAFVGWVKRSETHAEPIMKPCYEKPGSFTLTIIATCATPDEDIEQRIVRFDRQLLQGLKDETGALTLLQTPPGVDLMGAAMLLVEIGSDMGAFGSADRLASWVGMCPGNNELAGKRNSGRMRKGNPYVRRLLCEVAHAASRTTSVFKSKFQALVVRRGHKRSIIAIAHKLLRTLFFMLQRHEALPGLFRRLRETRGSTQRGSLAKISDQVRFRRSSRFSLTLLIAFFS